MYFFGKVEVEKACGWGAAGIVRYENKIYKLQKQKEEEVAQLVEQQKVGSSPHLVCVHRTHRTHPCGWMGQVGGWV